jgi:acid phosphatase family membrane protein YuiD
MPVRAQLRLLLSSPVFLSCIFSWFFAQFVKTVIKLITGKVSDLGELLSFLFWRTGGMPSSHAALLSCLCVSIGFRNGFDSDIFVLALGFFMIVIRDAVGVRRANGLQAKAINELGTKLSNKGLLDFRSVREVHGHTPLEVTVGCLLGLFIGVAFATL